MFTGGGSLADGQKLYADIKGRMEKIGRDPEHLKILPGAFVVVGDSVEEAKEKRALLDSRVHYDSAIASLSVILGTDASGFDPDGQLPPIPETNASKSGRQRLVDVAARDKLTVRQLAQRVGGYGGLAFVGTPQTIADQMEEWLVGRGSDGFNIMFPYPARRACSNSSTRWCRNCRSAESSAESTRGGHCARIWACRGRKTSSSRANWPESGDDFRPGNP